MSENPSQEVELADEKTEPTGKEVASPKITIDLSQLESKKPKLFWSDDFSYDGSFSTTEGLKYPSMDWQMNKYMERADDNDPTCLRVNMDEGKRIDFNDNPENEEVIFTYGLCGCIATGLVLKMKNGKEKVILTHNSPLTTRVGSETIRRLGADIEPSEVEKAKLFILAPGEYVQNSEGKWEQKIKSRDEMHTNLLEVSAQIVAGQKTEIVKIGYSESQNFGEKNQGTFRIVKGKDGKVKFIVENYYPSGEVFT